MDRSEAFLYAAFQSLAVGAALIDQAGSMRLVNPALEALFGYDSGELVGQPLARVLPDIPAANRGVQARNDHAALHEYVGTQSREVVGRHRNNNRFMVEVNAITADTHGEPMAIVFVAPAVVHSRHGDERNDVLARERAACAEAEASQHKIAALATASKTFSEAGLDLANLLDNIVQLVSETLGDSCILCLLDDNNRRASSFVAYHPDPDVCATIRAMIPVAFHVDAGLIHHVIQTGQPLLVPAITPAILEQAANPYLQVYIERFGMHSLIIVPLRVQDAVTGILAVGRDQSPVAYTDDDAAFVQDLADRAALAIHTARLYGDVRTSSQQAHEALELLNTFFQDASVGFAVLDQDLRYQRINNRLAEINGVSAAAHVGRTVHEILPELAPQAMPLLRHVLATGEPRLNVELYGTTLSHPDQPGYWLSNYYPIHSSDGSVRGIGIVVIDSTAQKRAEARQAMHFNVTRILAEASTQADAVPKLLEAICVGDGWQLGELWRMDDTTDVLRLDSYWQAPSLTGGFPAMSERKTFFQLGTTIASHVSERNTPMWYDHAMLENLWAQTFNHNQPQLHAAFAFPVRNDGTVMGVMVFFSRDRCTCTDELLQIGADLGTQVGQFFIHRQAEQRLVQHMQRLKALHSISQAILAVQSPQEIAGPALHHLIGLMMCSYASVATFDFDANESVAWIVKADSPDHTPRESRYSLSHFAYLDVLMRGESIFVHDLRQGVNPTPIQQAIRKEDILSFVGVPISLQGTLIGAIYLWAEWPHAFTSEAVIVIREVADLLAIALQNAHLFQQVRTSRERLQLLSSQLVKTQEEERRHLARELHDEVGQSLTALHLNLQLLAGAKNQQEGAARLEESTMLVESVLHQVRTMSLELRPSMLDDLGLVAALRWLLTRQAERIGFRFRLQAHDTDERFPHDIETMSFRVVQEALNNIVRHAHAEHVMVALIQHNDMLHLLIQDDGIGFNVAAARDHATHGHSLGLLSMQERVELAGGKIVIESEIGYGTTIRVWLPLHSAQFGLNIERRRSAR